MVLLLQILSSLDIVIPMHLLLKMFKMGVEQINSDPEDATEGHTHNILPSNSPVDDYPPPLSPERQPHYNNSFEVYERETELILPCFIMQLDMCLKQVGGHVSETGGWVDLFHRQVGGHVPQVGGLVGIDRRVGKYCCEIPLVQTSHNCCKSQHYESKTKLLEIAHLSGTKLQYLKNGSKKALKKC